MSLLLASLVIAPLSLAPGLTTRWTAGVDPAHPLPEYPRPQLVRKGWTNLNGRWEFAFGRERPARFDRQVVVPFPVESRLSGIGRQPPAGESMWYRRSFARPAVSPDGRVLLHFGAVDHQAEVWINGRRVGAHRGGYDPFTFDVTEALRPGRTQEILVRAEDAGNAGFGPNGKQARDPSGIFYTGSSGIWQTVWIEAVPGVSIERLRIVPDVDRSTVRIVAERRGGSGRVRLTVLNGSARNESARVAGATIPLDRPDAEIRIARPRLWSPDDPFLYGLRAELLDERGAVTDRVDSYFGMRKVSVGPDERGRTRILLNGKPLFLAGTLDQGFWPDGLYTAPTDEALRWDIEQTQRFGFNSIRKHVKVEPARWYAHCDRLGVLVVQDMPSGDAHIGLTGPDLVRGHDSARGFDRELAAMIDAFENHPSIVMWTLFNEGWGQSDVRRIADWAHRRDPSRLIDATSGWVDRGVGDTIDEHIYNGPGSPKPEARRAAVLGEFGGFGLALKGHLWSGTGWGWTTFETGEEFTRAVVGVLEGLSLYAADPGLSAAFYTQFSDVESEANGLVTYDRAVVKANPVLVRRALALLAGPPPRVTTLLAAAPDGASLWRTSEANPGPGWERPEFADAAWPERPGGFGTSDTPGSLVRTPWTSEHLWLRRAFTLERPVSGELWLRLHNDDEAEIFLDGVPVARSGYYKREYQLVKLPTMGLAAGRHVLAIHAHQGGGGQYIDAGLVEVLRK